MKKLLAIMLATFGLSTFSQADVYPNTDIQVVKKGLENAHENVPPSFEQDNKDSGILPRSGLYFPPMIPHSITGMQVSKNTNRCLDCHSPDIAPITGATVPSKTHFYDRAGKLGESVSPRRYFCLQCHTPQTNAPLITEQEYRPDTAFKGDQDKEKLPPMTVTPGFDQQFKQTLEDFKHSSDKYLNEHH